MYTVMNVSLILIILIIFIFIFTYLYKWLNPGCIEDCSFPKECNCKMCAEIKFKNNFLSNLFKNRLDKVKANALLAGKKEPNDIAMNNSLIILKILFDHDIKPDRIVADSDGGIGIYISGTNGRGRFVADNDGDFIVSMATSNKNKLHVYEFKIHEVEYMVNLMKDKVKC
jgi:hypothetical protein